MNNFPFTHSHNLPGDAKIVITGVYPIPFYNSFISKTS